MDQFSQVRKEPQSWSAAISPAGSGTAPLCNCAAATQTAAIHHPAAIPLALLLGWHPQGGVVLGCCIPAGLCSWCLLVLPAVG